MMEKVDNTGSCLAQKQIGSGLDRILVVDDEPAIAGLQKQFLEQLGYSVKAMTCATEALVYFEADPQQYDLLITDMAMPIMSGDELIRLIKAIRPDIRVILCAGYNEKIDRQKILEFGIDGYLFKPVGSSAFAHIIRKITEGMAGEREA